MTTDERAALAGPARCLICGTTRPRDIRRHMRRQHKAFLGWDPVDREWTYIYD